jgi:hypothetical protein
VFYQIATLFFRLPYQSSNTFYQGLGATKKPQIEKQNIDVAKKKL